MTDLMTKNPVDSIFKWQSDPVVKSLEEKGMKGEMLLFTHFIFERGDMTAHNIIDWTDYFWKISTSNKAVKEQCYKYINYAYYANPYNINVAIKAADLLARIGNFNGAETVLGTAIQKQKEIQQTDPKVFRPLELKLRDIQNGKL